MNSSHLWAGYASPCRVMSATEIYRLGGAVGAMVAKAAQVTIAIKV